MAELPPRTRIEEGACPSIDKPCRKGSGILRLLTMALTAVTKQMLLNVRLALV